MKSTSIDPSALTVSPTRATLKLGFMTPLPASTPFNPLVLSSGEASELLQDSPTFLPSLSMFSCGKGISYTLPKTLCNPYGLTRVLGEDGGRKGCGELDSSTKSAAMRDSNSKFGTWQWRASCRERLRYGFGCMDGMRLEVADGWKRTDGSQPVITDFELPIAFRTNLNF